MLTSTVLVKTSSFKFCVVAPEMFPNYRLLISFLQKCSSTAEVGYTIMYTSGKECLRQKETYTGTVHSVVDASKLLHHPINHGLDAGLVRDINLDSKCLEVCMLRVLLTFLRSLLGALFIQIREGNALYTGLCKGKGSLFADPGRGL